MNTPSPDSGEGLQLLHPMQAGLSLTGAAEVEGFTCCMWERSLQPGACEEP